MESFKNGAPKNRGKNIFTVSAQIQGSVGDFWFVKYWKFKDKNEIPLCSLTCSLNIKQEKKILTSLSKLKGV